MLLLRVVFYISIPDVSKMLINMHTEFYCTKSVEYKHTNVWSIKVKLDLIL